MRRALFTLALALLVVGCAGDDFGSFHFDGGALPAMDLAKHLAGFGAPCSMNGCESGLLCVTDFPNGMCARPCVLGQLNQCTGLNADCTDVGLSGGGGLCLPRCMVPVPCMRGSEGYACCHDGNLAGTIGVCAPTPTKVCMH